MQNLDLMRFVTFQTVLDSIEIDKKLDFSWQCEQGLKGREQELRTNIVLFTYKTEECQ